MVTGMYAGITHSASCPDVSPSDCAEAPIENHYHSQRLGWLRGGPIINIGIGRGVQIMAQVPVDLKVTRVRYLRENGEEFTPSYAGIHHRDEVLFGPVDGQFGFRWFGWVHPNLLLGTGAYTSLPWGRTEEDPFRLGRESKEHQHFQRGTGTFIPTVEGRAIWNNGTWGVMGVGRARVSLYENQKGYFRGSGVSWEVGPTYTFAAPISIYISAEGLHDSRDRWAGEFAPSSGQHALLSGLNLLYMASGNLVVQAQAKTTVFQMSLSDSTDDQLRQRIIGSLGFSWTAKPKSAHTH